MSVNIQDFYVKMIELLFFKHLSINLSGLFLVNDMFDLSYQLSILDEKLQYPKS